MKQYLLSIYQPDGDPPPPEVLEPVMQNVDALNEEMKAAGAWVFNGGLHPPSTATVVRLKEGEELMSDGPFAEGKEHVGGICIIKAPDLDAARTRPAHMDLPRAPPSRATRHRYNAGGADRAARA